MKPKLIDLGQPMARIEEGEKHEPVLTIMVPATEETEARSIEVWGAEGLKSLSIALADWLIDWELEQRAQQEGGDIPQ